MGERGSGGGTPTVRAGAAGRDALTRSPQKDFAVQIVLVSEGSQWSKSVRVTKDTTGKELLTSARERVKADGVRIPPVELQSLSLFLPAAPGAWIEEKKKLSKYKLADGVRRPPSLPVVSNDAGACRR